MKYQLGANVGESSIITAAGHLFAKSQGDLLWHEGGYGNLLLSHDVCTQSFMFNTDMCVEHTWGNSLGFGIEVDENLIEKFSLAIQVFYKS